MLISLLTSYLLIGSVSPVEAQLTPYCSQLVESNDQERIPEIFLEIIMTIQTVMQPSQWQEILITIRESPSPLNPLEREEATLELIAYRAQLSFLIDQISPLDWKSIQSRIEAILADSSSQAEQIKESRDKTVRVPVIESRPEIEVSGGLELDNGPSALNLAPDWVDLNGKPHLVFFDRLGNLSLINLETGEQESILSEFRGASEPHVFEHAGRSYAIFAFHRGDDQYRHSGVYIVDLLSREIVQDWKQVMRANFRFRVKRPFQIPDSPEGKPRFLIEDNESGYHELTFGESKTQRIGGKSSLIKYEIFKTIQFFSGPVFPRPGSKDYLFVQNNQYQYTIFSYPGMETVSTHEYQGPHEFPSFGSFTAHPPTVYIDSEDVPRFLMGPSMIEYEEDDFHELLMTWPALESKKYNRDSFPIHDPPQIHRPPVTTYQGKRLSVFTDIDYDTDGTDLLIIDLDQKELINRITFPQKLTPKSLVHFIEIDGDLFVFYQTRPISRSAPESDLITLHLVNVFEPSIHSTTEVPIQKIDTHFSIALSKDGPIAYMIRSQPVSPSEPTGDESREGKKVISFHLNPKR